MWFKKVIEVIGKGIALATGVLPLIQGIAPTKANVVNEISDDLTKIAGLVTTVEAIGASVSSPLSGPEKLKGIAPLVAQVILQSEFVVGKKVKDTAKFQAGVASIASGVADVLSSLEGDV